MANKPTPSTLNPKTGYNSVTKTYHSPYPPIPLPPLTVPVSATDYILSLLHVSPHFSLSSPFIISFPSSTSLSYSSFFRRVNSLSSFLSRFPVSSIALIISPPSLHIPVLYFSLLSLNVVVSPVNPLSTRSELTHLISISSPSVIFTVSSLVHKLPSRNNVPVILLDSAEFDSMLTHPTRPRHRVTFSQDDSAVVESPQPDRVNNSGVIRPLPGGGRVDSDEFDSKLTHPTPTPTCPSHRVTLSLDDSAVVDSPKPDRVNSGVLRPLPEEGRVDSDEFDSMLTHPTLTRPRPRHQVTVSQDDTAVILYSSGTTGRVKGVELTHRNLIALTAGYYYRYQEDDELTRTVSLVPLPLFHVFGFAMLLRAVTLSETIVLMERFDLEKMLNAVEKYKVTYIPVSPPLIVVMAKSELVNKYDISSLQRVACGGAPLGKEVALGFKARFPNIQIAQGYGLTEAGGGTARTIGPDEREKYGSVGRLLDLIQAKIVDPSTGEALPPEKQGELWLHGPTIMKGYIGDKEATAETLLPDGWLKTGDLCYFDIDGCLYIVDRLKELIKYKGYQVPPAELEHLLLSHPEISDAAVVPYPDEEAGQIPMAFVVRIPGGNISGAQVMDFVAKEVSPYKRIRRIAFVSAIPKNPSGKILRRELANQVTAGPSKL